MEEVLSKKVARFTAFKVAVTINYEHIVMCGIQNDQYSPLMLRQK